MKLNKVIGKFMNTVEHVIPSPFNLVVYWFLTNILWRLPIDFYSDECYLCRGKIWRCIKALQEASQDVE